MKKRTKIILIVVSAILIYVVYYVYQVYQRVLGSEKLTGVVEYVPQIEIKNIPELKFGADDWPHWRGLNFDGKSNTVGINTDWSSGIKKIWQVDYLCQGDATGSWSSVAIQGNRLVVPGRDEMHDMVFCLSTETGEIIWSELYESEAQTPHGKGARGTPFIDNDRVYTYGRSGDLVCWQLLDGKMLWRKNVREIGGKEPEWGYANSPIIFDDKVIVQGGGEALIIAYDKMNGDVVWKSQIGQAGFSSAITIYIDNDPYLLIYHGTGLSCVNPSDGFIVWNIPWETSYGVNATTPIVDNNLIFMTSGYGMGGQVIHTTKNDYKVLWFNKNVAAQHSDPVLIDGFLYGYSGQSTSNKGEFKCIELATGKEMWSTNEMGQGTTVYVDGYLICMNYKTKLFLVEPNPKEYKLIGKTDPIFEDVRYLAWTSPVIANGKLYIRYLQKLACLDLMP